MTDLDGDTQFLPHGAPPSARAERRSGPPVPRAAPADPEDLVGEFLGEFLDDDSGQRRFEIRRYLSGGGFGWVYEGRDHKFHARVAIKVMHVMAEDFEREARLARTLGGLTNHVVKVYDFGHDDCGRPWMAMEFIDGRTLESWLEEEPRWMLEGGRLERFLEQITEAMDRARDVIHASDDGGTIRLDVVHQDLKPANVMCRSRFGGEEFTILDFGLASAVPQLSGEQLQTMILEQEGGTPEYMAPERIEARAFSHKSDIYSVGVMLYQMLTGVVPFARKAAGRGALLDCLAAIRTGEIPRFRDVARFEPDPLSLKLEPLVRRCTALRPEDRPDSMQEVLDEYRSLVGVPAADSVPPPTRRPWLAISLALAAGVVVAGLIAWAAWRPADGLRVVPGTVTVSAGGQKEFHVAGGFADRLAEGDRLRIELLDNLDAFGIATIDGDRTGFRVTSRSPCETSGARSLAVRVSGADRIEELSIPVRVEPPQVVLPAGGRFVVEPVGNCPIAAQGRLFHAEVDLVRDDVRLRFLLIDPPDPPREISGRRVEPFYVARDLVTTGLFRTFAEETGEAAEWPVETSVEDLPAGVDSAPYPAVLVRVDEAERFCRWLAPSARLPDEREWRIVAGDPTEVGTTNDTGEGPYRGKWQPGASSIALNSSGRVPVGTSPDDTSPFGARDMAGNVRELTRTEIEPGAYGVVGSGFNDRKPVRYRDEDLVNDQIGIDKRFSTRMPDVGFRLVLELSPE